MKARYIVLLTVLLAIVTLSVISDDSVATDEVVFDGTFKQISDYSNMYEVYDSSTGTYSEIVLDPGAYRVTIGDTGYFRTWDGITSIYVTDGSSEFLLDKQSKFYFQSINSDKTDVNVEVLKLDVYVAESPYDESSYKTTFAVSAGTYTYDGPEAYLIIGGYEIYLSDTGYIPCDSSNAYFRSFNESYWYRMIDKGSFVNESVELDNVMMTTRGDQIGDELYIPGGTYKMTFSEDGYLSLLGSYHDYSFNADEEKEYTLPEGCYRYTSYNYYGQFMVSYKFNPEPSLEYVDDTYEFVESSTTTQYMWYKSVVRLDAGEHNISYYNYEAIYYLESQHDLENMFLTNVVDGNMTTIPDSYYYTQPNTFTLDSAMDVTIYVLIDNFDYTGYSMYYIDGNYYDDPGERLSVVKNDYIYVSANNPVTVALKYDSSKYFMYLMCGEELIGIPSGIVIDIDTDVSKEYQLVAEAKVKDSADSFTCQYEIYTDGLPESDDNAIVFAVVAIAICAVFFGLLLVSGRKPKWKD